MLKGRNVITAGYEAEKNEIFNMGLSGIGIPSVAIELVSGPTSVFSVPVLPFFILPAIQSRLGYPVVGLDIHENHIHDCLRAGIA